MKELERIHADNDKAYAEFLQKKAAVETTMDALSAKLTFGPDIEAELNARVHRGLAKLTREELSALKLFVGK